MSARIKPNQNPSPKAAELLEGVKKKLGSVPNIFKTIAHSPAALNFYLASSEALSHSKLPPTLREQIALTVAGKNGCDYCASAHTAIGKMQKIKEEELEQNLQGKSSQPKTQAALTFVNKIVNLKGQVTDRDLQAIRDAGYSDEEIVEMIALVSESIFTNYFNIIAQTEIDFPKVSTASLVH